MIETVEQNQTSSTVAGRAPATLVEGFRSHAAERPHDPAVYFRTSVSGIARYASMTWADVVAAADRLASFLLTEGVREQEHAAIWANNRPEWHIADMAILELRCRPVPVYLTLSSSQAGYVLSHSECRVVFVENQSLLGRVLEARSELPALTRVVVMEYAQENGHDGLVISWAEAMRRGETQMDKHRSEIDRRAESAVPDDIATLIYTSGTTGPPKAVQLTHGNVNTSMDALDSFLTLTPQDRVLSYLPLAHIAERLISEFRSYLKGNPVYFLDGMEHLGERLAEVRPTQFFGVPRVWEKMAQTVKTKVEESPFPRKQIARWALNVGSKVAQEKHAGRPVTGSLARRYAGADRLMLAKIRHTLGLDQASILATGAAPIDSEVLLFFSSLGLEVCEEYGQTEDCAIATINRPGEVRIGTVGKRLPGIDIKIAEDGEILVKGGNVFAGYFTDPEATKEAIVDGWLHTGDVGEFDADGYLRITDRKKDLMITAGGKNISPSNIEKMICRLDIISNAVVIGDRRPFVSGLITLDPEHQQRLTGPDGKLTEAARTRIDDHMREVNRSLAQVEQVKKWTILPSDFQTGDELTPTLKVKRKVVNEKYAEEIEALYGK